jgi:hypothetical protein
VKGSTSNTPNQGKALDFSGIIIRSKVLISLGTNKSLGPHPWQKPDLTDPCGGGVLQGSMIHLSGVGTRSSLAFGGSQIRLCIHLLISVFKLCRGEVSLMKLAWNVMSYHHQTTL